MSTVDLPTPRTALIGRDREVERIVEALDTGDSRLVSIIGSGGIGKTRTAIEVARRTGPRWADGATFVPLAGVAAAEHLADALAGSLQLAGSASTDILAALSDALRDREMLLVLDNFEQLRDGATPVVELLERCPALRVLVTSRTPLRVAREQRVELGPLRLPDAPTTGRELDLGALAEVDAVRLFVERANAVDADFRLSERSAGAVVDTVRELDGSPLAIELAAARLTLLTPDELRERLRANPLAVLSSGAGDLPERQRSVRATIAWSESLLADDERAALRRLAAFEHSFSLDAAEAIVSTAEHPVEMLDALSALVDAHLVEPSRRSSDESPRFSMPVVVRDVARELLVTSGEAPETRRRVTDETIRFVTEAGARLESEQEHTWLDLVGNELDQIRVSLDALAEQDADACLRLAVALGPYWLHRGLLGEGRRRLAAALDEDVASTLDPSLVAAAAAWEARLAADQGIVADRDGADAMVRQLELGLATARRDGDVHAELRCLDFLSHVLALHDDSGRATEVTDEGIARARTEARPWWLAQLLQRAAVFARMRDELDAAADLITEGYRIACELDAPRLILHAGLTVAQLPPNDRVPDPPDLDRLIELAVALGDQRMYCVVQMSLGIEAMLAGRTGDSATGFRRALGVARDTGYWHATGFSLMCSAALAAVVGDAEACARLHGAAHDAMPVLRRGMPPAYFHLYEDLVATARDGLGAGRFDQLGAETTSLGWDHATRVARSLLDRLAPTESALTRTPPTGPADGRSGVRGSADTNAHRLPLTDREAEVLACIAAGDTNKDVARRLAITPKTVMHHTTSIYRKLGVRGRAEAAAIGLRDGLIAR